MHFLKTFVARQTARRDLLNQVVDLNTVLGSAAYLLAPIQWGRSTPSLAPARLESVDDTRLALRH
jgi:hypothetical protein